MDRFIIFLLLGFVMISGCKTSKNRIILTPTDNLYSEIQKPPPVDTSKVLNYKALALFNKDTLAYLKHNFYYRQGVYLNKKLEILLNDLEVPVINYVFGSTPKDTVSTPFLYLHFHNGLQVLQREKARKPSFNLIITWKQPLHSSNGIALVRRSHGKWTPEANNYYKEQVVGTINIMKNSLQ